jgi:hypothetical protein
MSQSTTSERGSRIWRRQTHVSELAAGREVAPEHRPRRQPAAVRVELVAAGPAALEPRHEQVDQPLGLAQLGRRHPVELAVAQDLALRVGIGRDDDAVDRRFVAPSSSSRDRRAGSSGRIWPRSCRCPAAPRRRVLSSPTRPRGAASVAEVVGSAARGAATS